jgi:hypothetical protein
MDGKLMSTKKISAAIAAARKRAQQIKERNNHVPVSGELLTSEELADAAPFYSVLRAYIQQLQEAREAAGLTLADIAERTGMAIEALLGLEDGAQTNPTWKMLGLYALAVGRQPNLSAEVTG